MEENEKLHKIRVELEKAKKEKICVDKYRLLCYNESR